MQHAYKMVDRSTNEITNTYVKISRTFSAMSPFKYYGSHGDNNGGEP